METPPKRQAAILNIGTELLVGHVLNTHGQFLTKWLNHMGYSVHYHMSCGDSSRRIQEALHFLAKEAQLILVTGGLGPTQDDITRREVASFLEVPLVRDQGVVSDLIRQFEQWGRRPTENNFLQADFPEGATILENPKGTAPGFIASGKGLSIACLPGPPVEVKAVVEGALADYLAGGGQSLYSQYLTLYGIGESALDERIADLFEAQEDPTIGIYAQDGMITLRLSTVKGHRDEADRIFRPVVAAIQDRVDENIVSLVGLSIPQALLAALKEAGKTLALAESCTGGLASKLMTDIPGASTAFLGSAITYSNDAKGALLGVAEETLEAYGAVSEPVAVQMAMGACLRFSSDYGLAITGIAGPEGGTPDKPVGTVCFAYTRREGDRFISFAWTQRMPGDRGRVRLHSALTALRRLQCAICTDLPKALASQ